MTLSSVGNPDFQQYAPVSKPQAVRARSLRLLRTAAQKYIDYWSLGGGNWTSPVVYDRRGEAIGYFSYNLRLWRGNPLDDIDKVNKQEEILIP